MQQGLAIEVEHGFVNFLGREETFHSFIARKLANPPFDISSINVSSNLEELSKQFDDYPAKTESIKRRIIAQTRQYLNQLNLELSPLSPPSSLKLRFENKSYSNQINSQKTYNELTLNSVISDIKGVGVKIAEKFACLGIFNVKDLLLHYPRDYVDYSSLLKISQLNPGQSATLIAKVRSCYSFKSQKNSNLSILELNLEDATGRIEVTRFFAGYRFSNRTFLKTQTRLYKPGSTVAVSGMVKSGPYGKTFKDPMLELMESKSSAIKSKSIGQILPIYPLTDGLSPDRFRDVIEYVLPLTSQWPEFLPLKRLEVLSLPKKNEALKEIHKPFNQDSLKAARRRLVFDEFLMFQLGLLRRRIELRKRSAPSLAITWNKDGLVGRFLELLPFSLTNAQKKVLKAIETDLVQTEPMSRLVQGDVGSGKTVVAIAALLNAVEAGWQGAFMAPTEVLAVQHYRTLCKWLPQLHVNVELLTGSTTTKRRRQILDHLSSGSLNILIGTHALIEDPVSFLRLGLVVVDEQHRFGVQQRNRLLSKGLQPHLLTMTATPIPRTLALSLHGDLDVCQIDELPPGRTPIKTNLICSDQRDEAYQLIRDEVLKGQRAYFVLPLVEESEKLDLRSAIKVHKQLTEIVFPEFAVGLLHGRMNSHDKQSVIKDFVSGKCQVLVSTTVVEVGVDVVEATVMVIDHADRFGLAQLHQLRGRVGRGSQKSYCVLVNDSKNLLAKHRLEVLVSCNDGFEISEIDLRLRGPGQVLGTRQSGLPDFALASLIDDGDVLELARKEALYLLKTDPQLVSNSRLRKILNEHWAHLGNNANLN